MSYEAVRTDDGIEIRDGDEVIAVSKTWPPREPDVLDILFDHANISQPTKGLLNILFAVTELEHEDEE